MPPTLLPLKEAYRYWPSDREVYIDSEPPQRFVFSRQSYTAFEQQQLLALGRLLREKEVPLPMEWDEGDLLRYIYAAGFKVHQAATLLRQATDWRNKVFHTDYRHLYASLRSVLCSGFIYIHGRDHVYRPCVVLDYTKLSLRNAPLEHYLLAMTFTLEYVTRNMLIPGQVETWVMVTDLGRREVEKLATSVRPTQDFQKAIEVLQTGFPGRLAANYILNSPDNITQTWAIVRQFLRKDTAEKHFTTKKNFSRKMLTHFSPLQVPKRYGGKARDPTNFWPPTIPPGPFNAPGESQGKLYTESRLSQKSSYCDFFPEQNADTEIQEQESIEKGGVSIFSDRSLSILEVLRAGESKADQQLDVCFVADEEEPARSPAPSPTGDLSALGTERLRLRDTLASPREEAKRHEITHRQLLSGRDQPLETLLEGQEVVGCSWNCRTCAAPDPTESFCSLS